MSKKLCIIILIIVLLFILSCIHIFGKHQTEEESAWFGPVGDYHPYHKKYIPTIGDSLFLDAYYKGNESVLDSFFVQWEQDSRSIDTNEFNNLNDTIKSIYRLFKDFYQLDTLYDKYQYIILQNEVDYIILDEKIYNELKMNFGTIDYDVYPMKYKDFRPAIRGREIGILYFNDIYFHRLNYFLNEENGYYPYINKFAGKKIENPFGSCFDFNGFCQNNLFQQCHILFPHILVFG